MNQDSKGWYRWALGLGIPLVVAGAIVAYQPAAAHFARSAAEKKVRLVARTAVKSFEQFMACMLPKHKPGDTAWAMALLRRRTRSANESTRTAGCYKQLVRSLKGSGTGPEWKHPLLARFEESVGDAKIELTFKWASFQFWTPQKQCSLMKTLADATSKLAALASVPLTWKIPNSCLVPLKARVFVPFPRLFWERNEGFYNWYAHEWIDNGRLQAKVYFGEKKFSYRGELAESALVRARNTKTWEVLPHNLRYESGSHCRFGGIWIRKPGTGPRETC